MGPYQSTLLYVAAAIAVTANPLRAITITDASLNGAFYSILSQSGSVYNGIGILQNGTNPGSGGSCTAFAISPTLVLTAAHCVAITGAGSAVFFPMENLVVTPDLIVTHPSANSNLAYGNDLALLRFSNGFGSAVPINYYPIYQSNAFPVEVELFGYGSCGSGSLGYNVNTCGSLQTLHRATNTFEATLGPPVNGAPVTNIALYDFDNPSENTLSPNGNCRLNRALCYITAPGALPASEANLSSTQGMIAFGDSGGPSLVNVGGQLQAAGVHSFITCIGGPNTCTVPPFSSTSGAQISAFGTIGGDTFLSPYSSFVAQYEAPEPSTAAVGAAGLAVLLYFARRRAL